MINLYSFVAPAKDAIEYHTVVFSSSFGKKKTKYQGPPTDKVDALWSGLYDGMPQLQSLLKPSNRIIEPN
jgi:hypothetical protein